MIYKHSVYEMSTADSWSWRSINRWLSTSSWLKISQCNLKQWKRRRRGSASSKRRRNSYSMSAARRPVGVQAVKMAIGLGSWRRRSKCRIEEKLDEEAYQILQMSALGWGKCLTELGSALTGSVCKCCHFLETAVAHPLPNMQACGWSSLPCISI